MSQDEDSPEVAYDSGSDEQDQKFLDDVPAKAYALPLFHVSVTEAIKDGTSLEFTIMSTRTEREEGLVVTRQFEDVEWLHHQLIIGNNIKGIIVPPLPAKPEFDPKSAESKSKKQLGSDSNILKPDDFDLECKAIQKYLSSMLSHPLFGRDGNLELFLSEKDAPVRAKISKGIVGWLSSAIDSARKGQHKDIDEYFGTQREWCTEYTKVAKEMSQNFNKMVQCQWRLSAAYRNLSTSLRSVSPSENESLKALNGIFLRFSEALENAQVGFGGGPSHFSTVYKSLQDFFVLQDPFMFKKGLEVLSRNDEKLLGFELDLLARNMDSVKEMLFQRTCLLVNYEDANRALEKAKLPKRQAAEETKVAAESEYRECTETAQKELRSFKHQRVLAMQDGLCLFTEAQMKTSQDTYTLLIRTLKAIQTEM